VNVITCLLVVANIFQISPE